MHFLGLQLPETMLRPVLLLALLGQYRYKIDFETWEVPALEKREQYINGVLSYDEFEYKCSVPITAYQEPSRSVDM